jgi:hypothetical protein
LMALGKRDVIGQSKGSSSCTHGNTTHLAGGTRIGYNEVERGPLGRGHGDLRCAEFNVGGSHIVVKHANHRDRGLAHTPGSAAHVDIDAARTLYYRVVSDLVDNMRCERSGPPEQCTQDACQSMISEPDEGMHDDSAEQAAGTAPAREE